MDRLFAAVPEWSESSSKRTVRKEVLLGNHDTIMLSHSSRAFASMVMMPNGIATNSTSEAYKCWPGRVYMIYSYGDNMRLNHNAVEHWECV